MEAYAIKNSAVKTHTIRMIRKKHTLCRLRHFNTLFCSQVGKSATANTLLGRHAFQSHHSSESVTRNNQLHDVIWRGFRIKVRHHALAHGGCRAVEVGPLSPELIGIDIGIFSSLSILNINS